MSTSQGWPQHVPQSGTWLWLGPQFNGLNQSPIVVSQYAKYTQSPAPRLPGKAHSAKALTPSRITFLQLSIIRGFEFRFHDLSFRKWLLSYWFSLLQLFASQGLLNPPKKRQAF